MTDPRNQIPASTCPECMDHYFSSPGLVGACASVGIERGLSTGEMLRRYLDGYHQRGHRGFDQPAQHGAASA